MITVQHVVFSQDQAKSPLYVEQSRGGAPAHHTVVDRGRLAVAAQSQASLASYFNAFPATYWAAHTGVSDVRFSVDLTGTGRVVVLRSDAHGLVSTVGSYEFADETLEVDLTLDGFAAGGWLWCEVHAETDVELSAGSWQVEAEPARSGAALVGITTMNKPDYCVRNLEAFADSSDVVDVISEIVVVDQGQRLVAEEPGYDAVAARLGDRHRIVRQSNLGGSGGFSRAMLESLDADDADFVLLLDDDVTIEPEGVRRAVQFARFCAEPTIVGGHMFDMYRQTSLHSVSEVVRPENFMWGPSVPATPGVDFAVDTLQTADWLHRRYVPDYNGWWMCLIPVEVVRRIGLSMPYFIKWDDAEYGLRAKADGVATVSLPGVALWHITWQNKDDSIDWQAYFHARNRIASALVHSPQVSDGLVKDSGRLSFKHLLSMQYYAASLRNQAIRDVLTGPEHLHAGIATALPELRASAKEFHETRSFTTEDPAPPSPSPVSRPKARPEGRLALGRFTLAMARRHLTADVPPEAADRPDVVLARRDAQWWTLPRYDSVLVRSADGRSGNWFLRDRTRFRELWRESRTLHRRLRKEWPDLSRRYREAAAEVSSPQAWRATIGIDGSTHE